jgi:hypothetical protein
VLLESREIEASEPTRAKNQHPKIVEKLKMLSIMI